MQTTIKTSTFVPKRHARSHTHNIGVFCEILDSPFCAFQVNGADIPGLAIKNVFDLLGTSEVFPCVSFSPPNLEVSLDEDTADNTSAQDGAILQKESSAKDEHAKPAEWQLVEAGAWSA